LIKNTDKQWRPEGIGKWW